MLVLTAHTAPTISVAAFNRASVMEDQLPYPLANRQYDTFVHVQVVDFERNAVDVARIDPTGVKTDRYAVATPAAARFYLAGTAMSTDADEFVRVCQDTLAGLQDDDRMIFRDIFEQFDAVLIAPFLVRDRFERPFEIPIDIRLVEWIVDAGSFRLIFLFIKIMSEREVEAGLTDVLAIKRYANDRAVSYRRPDFGITVYSHNY